MSLNEGLALACILIPAVILLVCLCALCIALSKFASKIQAQMPTEIEKSVIFDLEYGSDDGVQETAL